MGPDVIVGSLPNVSSYGTDGSGIYAYAVGTTSCNIGDMELDWIASNNQHPVIGQSLYKLHEGRFTHVGQSWLKHGFTALQGTVCGSCSPSSSGGSALGIGCSDPYGSGLNGSQGGLGPKYQVNATTGEFPYPPASPPYPPTIGRRIQVHEDDLNPALNVGAQYFVEGHYVTLDDAEWGNAENNASYRAANVSSGGNYDLSLFGPTVREEPAIYAWAANDPEVVIQTVDIPGDGRFVVAYKTTLNPGGTWHYEYAVHNINSHLSMQKLALPVDASVTLINTGFHDVDYHSGEPFVGTDWDFQRTAAITSWECETFATNENANALRWGTLYNFWFDADSEPIDHLATLVTFRDGGAAQTQFPIKVPNTLGAAALDAPSDLVCSELNHDVSLSWTNNDNYAEIEVSRDGNVVATLPGDATSFEEQDVPVGSYFYDIVGIDGADNSNPAFCALNVVGLPIPANLDCSETGGDVTLAWSNPFAYTSIEIYRDAQLIGTLPGDATSYIDAGLTNGGYLYQIVAVEGSNQVSTECNVVVLGGPTTGAVIVWKPNAGSGGDGLALALVSNGMSVVEETNLSAQPLAAFDACFVALGMYPNNHAMTGTEGQLLADFVSAGGRVYFEGGDTFNFDAPTALHGIDGISSPSDGTDDLFNVTGLDGGNGLDLSAFADRAYSGENNWVDHLQADTPEAAAIWTNTAEPYDCGVFKAADSVGPVIGCSFQFYGIGTTDDQEQVMALYLDALGLGATGAVTFKRGDANNDGNVQISDVIFTLEHLFVSGAAPDCFKSADVNDSGAVDVSDASYLINYLFVGGTAPVDPFLTCGEDSTDDALTCDDYSACP